MAEFENNHCTGCGYRVGHHRPYCWRVVTALVNADTSMKNIRRCLKIMNKYDRIQSLFFAKKEHIYYTIESIDAGVKEKAFCEGLHGYYECNNCGYTELSEREVRCWECHKGEMLWHDIAPSTQQERAE